MPEGGEDIELALQRARAVTDGARAAVHCTGEGMILATDADPEIDESILGDVLAAATRLAEAASPLTPGDSVKTVLYTNRAAVAARRLADGTWVGLFLEEPAAIGLALEALDALG
jgi:predicted regulator of Ras-like GTPase activity (Roadblock/LC7/MglB family)